MSKYGYQTYDTLKSNKLAPKKRFGQNFLVNRHTAEAIVIAGGVCKEDIILEVGVGLGALTTPLAAAAKHVLGFEIDSGIIRFHETEGDLPDNVTLTHQDILTADFDEIAEKCGGKLKILANLPYSISNPFVFKLIDNFALINNATVMLQKEVADRLMAEPQSKDYGVPTVMLRSCATVRKLMTLKPAEFHPRPKVDSVVVNIDFEAVPDHLRKEKEYDFNLFRQVVRVTFNQRRKTILNTLSGAGLFAGSAKENKATNKELTKLAIDRTGLSASARPETLTVSDFIKLTNEIEMFKKSTSISTDELR